MRRIIAVLLACVIAVTGCGSSASGNGLGSSAVSSTETVSETEETIIEEKTAETTVETQTETDQMSVEQTSEESKTDSVTNLNVEEAEKEYLLAQSYSGLNDPKLLQQVEDSVYSGLVDEFNNEDYIIENVNAVYISKEYLEELDYNSRANR